MASGQASVRGAERANKAADAARSDAPFLAAVRPWQRPPGLSLANAMTCDVEDYFQVSAFEHLVPKSRWNEFDCRIPRNIDRTLEIFSAAGVRGTFFILGWVAQHHPEVVRRIAAAGHEVASHGMLHMRVSAQTPNEFRADAGTAKKLLEDVTGMPVQGYRAASWSIDQRTPWAHAVLREVGYRYSSSLYPVAHDHYGVPQAPRGPFYVESADILEIPATTARFAGRNWPASGGGYFRLLPLPVSEWLLRRVRNTDDFPVVFYFHPWELDPDQPRMPNISRKTRFRHYLNLHKFEARLQKLVKSFAWERMDRLFGLHHEGTDR